MPRGGASTHSNKKKASVMTPLSHNTQTKIVIPSKPPKHPKLAQRTATMTTMSDDDQEQRTTSAQEDIPFSYWRVWKAVTALETDGMTTTMPNSCYDDTIAQVVSILRLWGQAWAGKPGWQSLLNKPSLQHEAEESIVALYHLHEWLLTRDDKEEPLIVVDVCCGKGLFSMLLSYMMGSFWKSDASITRIIMLDKMTSKDVSWSHVHGANKTASEENRPSMELWEGCNLHDYDIVLSRLQGLEATLALVGIHLCKTLGPSCVSLANGCGPKKCPFLCLAPCCMPRLVTTKKAKSRCIPVNLYENEQERKNRLDAMKRRNEALRRGRHGECYLCAGQHRVRDCPQLPMDGEERVSVLQKATATVPCWRCGVVGHFKADCPSTLSRPPRLEPPCVTMNVEGLLQEPQPFGRYCQLIADTVQSFSSKHVVETGLSTLR